MTLYMLRTLFKMALTLFAIITLVFFATRLSGSPLETFLGDGLTEEDRMLMIEYFGLEGSIWQQYVAYLRGMLEGNFGLSFLERRPVAEIVAARIWPSLQLLLSALAVTLCVALPLGILAALYRTSWIGSAIMALALVGYAVPNFVIATFMVLIFAFVLNWLPVVGNGTWAHFIMPTIAMSGVLIAALTRFTRNAMLDVLGQDFMRTARAKGLTRRQALMRHGLRNAMIPVLTIIGMQFSFLLAGAIIIEQVFFLPGLGRLIFQSISARDLIVVESVVMLLVFMVILVTFLVDLAYAAVDPRLRSRT